jgi:hypothetical protein
MITGDGGAQVVDLGTARAARLGRSLQPVLEDGHGIADVSTVTNVDEWRKAVRRVAAAQGWRVRTGVTRDGSRVWAVRLDRETTDQDRPALRERLAYLGALLADG